MWLCLFAAYAMAVGDNETDVCMDLISDGSHVYYTVDFNDG